MSFADTIKGLIFKKPATAERDARDPRRSNEPMKAAAAPARPKTPIWPLAVPGTIMLVRSFPSARPGR
jgi:hypothetical protein